MAMRETRFGAILANGIESVAAPRVSSTSTHVRITTSVQMHIVTVTIGSLRLATRD